MKKDTLFKLFIIILFSFLIRVWFLDKPEGLYFDEYFGWMIASKPTISEFFKAVMQNCHTPLYYVYLKFWIFLFSDSDLSLRFSSVLPSVLSVFTMYLLGKEFKDKNLGILCALFTAISSFCIYFAQEVRLYSLLFLVSSLAFYYFIRSVKTNKKSDFILFFVANAVLCSIHTLGIIFSVFLILFLFAYLFICFDKNSDKFKKLISKIRYIYLFTFVIIILIPFLYNIALSKNLSQFWADFSYVKIICVSVDYFSPIQTNIINTLDNFYEYIYLNGKFNYSFVFFGLLPLIIGTAGIIRAVIDKNKVLNYILAACFLFFISVVLLAITGKLILITKYTIEIYPAVILALMYGLSLFSNKKTSVVLLISFLILHLFYLFFSDNSAPKKTRPEGHRAVVELLKYSRLKQSDFVLLTYYDKEKFEKYLDSNTNFNFFSVSKYNFNYFLFKEDDYNKVIREGKKLYKDYFREYPNQIICDFIKYQFIYNMNKGDRIGIVVLDSVSFIRYDSLERIVNDDIEYNKIPFIFLVFSSLKNNALYTCKKTLKLDTITHAGQWTLYVYEKVD